MARTIKSITPKVVAPMPASTGLTTANIPTLESTPEIPLLSDEQLLRIIPSHTCCIYGDSGTGKSTLAAKFPKTPERPQLVIMMDPPSKAHPYREGYEVVPIEDEFYTQAGIVAESCLDNKGREVRRIECYIDPDVDNPRAAANVEARFAGFYSEAPNWSSVVFDSMTYFQYASLRRQRHLFPMEKGKEQGQNLAWFNGVKQDVERVLKSQAVWWPTTTLAIFHTSEDKAEFASETLRGLLAVGKLPRELPAGFSEMYHTFVKRVGDNYKYLLSTKHDGLWAATSIVAKAPTTCESDFRSIWANYIASHPLK